MSFDFKNLTGDIVTRDDYRYKESIQAWNRAIEKFPLAICYCEREDDICNGIKWARENSIPFRIRSGAHHYEGFSSGNDVLVIDISRLNSIELDEENDIVKIQGGVRNRELYEVLGNSGYAFPGGGCPTVGVAGFTLGGGWGYSARLLGLACDSAIEFKLIDNSGKLIIASENCNEDLFWALRGCGGGNFGIVSEITFKLDKKIEMATYIIVDFFNANTEDQVKIFEEFQKSYETLDRRANFKMAVYNSTTKGRGIRITGLFYGNREEAEGLLQNYKDLNIDINIKLEYMRVLDVNRAIQDSHPDFESYKSTGRFVYRDYSSKEIIELIDLLESTPEGSIYSAISLYGLGGAIRDNTVDSTAFFHRDANFIMGMQSVFEDNKYSEKNSGWVKRVFNISKNMTEGSFINFPIADLENYEYEYYGRHMHRLRDIKKKYDADNIFDFPQSIKIK